MLGEQRGAAAEQTNQHKCRRTCRGAGRQLRERERIRPLGEQGDACPEREDSEAEPDPVDERVHDNLQTGRLRRRAFLVGGEDDIQILGDGASNGDLCRRFVFVLAEVPPRRIHRIDLLAVLEHGDERRDHLLLAIVVQLDAVIAKRVAADRHLLPRLEQDLLVALVRIPREAQEDQHDAHVHDVAAIPPFVAADEPDERREEIRPGVLAPNLRAAPELLSDRPGHEGAQRKTGQRRPLPQADRKEPGGREHARRDREQEGIAQVDERRFPPGQ